MGTNKQNLSTKNIGESDKLESMEHLSRQQTKILQILRDCGETGMNSYTYRMQFIQLPARIKELKDKGYYITSHTNKNRSVNYILPTSIVQFPRVSEGKIIFISEQKINL